MISPKELEEALNSETKRATGKQISSIFKHVDYRGNGKINYSEFLAATVSVTQVLTQEKLFALFKHFDTDDSDYITAQNLKEAFEVGGRDLDDSEV